VIITKITSIPVLGPRKEVYGRAYESGLGAAVMSEHGIILMETDTGIVGIGEISSVFKRRGKLYCREVDEVLAPALIGEDPFRIAYLAKKMESSLDGSEPAKAGLEMALFDIVGKALGTPVYNLLGGMVRERISLSYSIPFGTPQEMAAFGASKAREGFRTVKMKVGRDRVTDVAAVKEVRGAIGPDVKLRIDANMCWRTAKEAISIIRQMENYSLEIVEQPLPARELDAIAEVRRNVTVPIMVDESVWSPRDAMEVIRRGAADVVNVYVSESGGLLNAAQIFSVCQLAGIPCMIGSMPEFGIGTVAQIHLGVAMTNLGPDSDACGVLYHAEDLLTEPLKIEGGFSYPPAGPGLGVTINPQTLERWRIKGQ
jgi:L-alanine-DL-glutamate epimerase-like enolase superfamily enzyme